MNHQKIQRALCLAAIIVPLSVPVAAAANPLRVHAAARGKVIGAALANSPLSTDTTYRNLAASEFSQVTAENAMKWDATEPSQGNFTFTQADQIVSFAQLNNQVVHGHTLVWHNQTPSWVQSLNATQMRSAMQNHIAQVVGHYASNASVVSWDVVNEVFEDNGTLRNSFWLQRLGDSYIADAFRAARAADSDAILCINDFNVEDINAKSTAMFNLVQTLRAQGVPIDCVGFQGHLAIQFSFPGQLQQNIQRFAGLGVMVRFTELDVRMQLPRDATKDTTQATYYTNVVNACLNSTACMGVTIWGFTDRFSWVPGTFSGQGAALIYDDNYNVKPSYTAVHNTLEGAVSDTTPPTVPGNLTSSGVTSSSVNLSWAASTDNVGVAAYDISRALGATGGSFAQVGMTSGTSFTNTGLSANTTYRFQVQARDAANNSSIASNSVTVTTLPGNTGGGCTASAVVQSQWQNGYVLQPVNVTNNGTQAIAGWTVTFTLPPGHTISNAWNATTTISGQTVTARNVSYNGALAANGGRTDFGFQATRPNGDTQLPSGFTCAGQ